MQTEEVIRIFRQRGGYLSSNELIRQKVHTSFLRALLEAGEIVKVKRGLYRLPAWQLPQDRKFTHDFFDAAIGASRGVFCLITALRFHELTTHMPTIFDMAIPPTNRNPKLFTVAVRFYRFQEPYYSLGIEQIDTTVVPVRIYNQEKSVCDVIRLRKLVGEDVAMEALNTYLKQQKKNINKLLETAKLCKVKHIVAPAVKAITGF